MKPPLCSGHTKWLLRIVFAAAVLVTLLALVVAVENYRAKRAWLACKQESEAKGENLDWESVLPKAVPDDGNFLATPVLAGCFGFAPGPNGTRQDLGDTNACAQLASRFSWAGGLPSPGNWRSGKARPFAESLAEWQSEIRSTNSTAHGESLAALRARPAGSPTDDLRFLLAQSKAVLDEIRVAARRPYAQIKITSPPKVDIREVVGGPLLSQLATLRSPLFVLRASCWMELAGGNPEAACADIMTMLKLSDAAGSQPLLIALLVKISMIDLAADSLWLGLTEHRWKDAQLARFEERLSQINVVADYERCIRGERAFSLATLGAYPERASWRSVRFWPRAMTYRNQINLVRAYQAFFLDRIDPEGPAIRLPNPATEPPEVSRFRARSLYNLFVPAVLPAIEKTMGKIAYSQATISLARVACALERYRLINNRYPEKLADLASGFLARIPSDPVTGEPLKYRLNAADQYTLYSVGLDGEDDGGQTSDKRTIKDRLDWVWQSRATEAAR